MRNLSIRVRILGIVGLGVLCAVGGAGYLLLTLGRVNAGYGAMLRAEVAQQDRARVMQVAFKIQVQEWKNILLRGRNPEALAKHKAGFLAEAEAVTRHANELAAEVTVPEVKAQLGEFMQAHDEMDQAYGEALAKFEKTRGRDFAGADKMVKGKDRAPTELVDRMVEQLGERVKSSGAALQTSVSETRKWIAIVMGVVLLVVVVVSLVIAKGITGPLQATVGMLRDIAEGEGDLTKRLDVASGDELGELAIWFNRFMDNLQSILQQVRGTAASVASASQQLSAASEEISSGAQEQASSLEETASSLEEITSTIKHNSDNSQSASQLAGGARDVAEQGGRVVSEAVGAMSAINQASKQIADIITTIDEIAFQTNLLALNAAVEAARAGEQGRGFAVVAAEVRNLAQRSATAAKEIKGLIQDSVRKVDAGSELVTRSGNTLQEIVTSVKRVTDIVAEIAAASREQAAGIDQVNRAVSQMDSVTQSNAGQTEELSGTAQALSAQAVQLQALVGRFKLDDGVTAAPAVTAPAAPRSAPAPRPAGRKPAARKARPAPVTTHAGNGSVPPSGSITSLDDEAGPDATFEEF
jgi:methyl-accepting chemotaxis protein